MRILLDHHYSPTIATMLRERDHDAIACVERGWHTASDEDLLSLSTGEGRALVTNNVSDLMAIQRAWSAIGRSHAGLIFTSDARMPRTKAAIGLHVDALARVMASHAPPATLRDQIVWLVPSP